ncbi:hypothetical protein ACFJIX_18305 [Roseateles sp. UC29_93]|uniref:hypothetical protein n=1 Tax=Roseateles sp. UC29_93 TaxID=3350177 RepID=UPI00366E90DA
MDDVARRLQRRETLGQPAQVLDQHDAQRRRQRPQLGQRERAFLLVRTQVGGQQLGVEAAVGVRDPGPGDAVDAGQAGQRFVAQSRQQPEETARQAAPHLMGLFVDQRGVVQQPFAGGAEVAEVAMALLDQAPRLLQHRDVVVETREELAGAGRALDRLRLREAAPVLLEARQTEQHGPDRRLDRAECRVEQRKFFRNFRGGVRPRLGGAVRRSLRRGRRRSMWVVRAPDFGHSQWANRPKVMALRAAVVASRGSTSPRARSANNATPNHRPRAFAHCIRWRCSALAWSLMCGTAVPTGPTWTIGLSGPTGLFMVGTSLQVDEAV